MTATITPMMQQYLDVKRQHPEAILLFRMGDFYETFYEDAKNAAKALGLTLTSRDKSSSNPIPMTGFPYHALDAYLRKLILAGYRVSVCDQAEDAKPPEWNLKRGLAQVARQGTLFD